MYQNNMCRCLRNIGCILYLIDVFFVLIDPISTFISTDTANKAKTEMRIDHGITAMLSDNSRLHINLEYRISI